MEQTELSSSPKHPNVWRQTRPVALCCILLLSDLLLTLNSFCSLLFFEGFFFFCCCSYFPLTLIIQMYWGPCALPHHKGNHKPSDQKICQMYSPGRSHTGVTAQAARLGWVAHKPGWGHHLLPEKGTTEERSSVHTQSNIWGLILLVFGLGVVRGWFVCFALVHVLTALIL